MLLSNKGITYQKQSVFVGLSGGVDSSVSAALLQRAGFNVTGVFIKVWSPDWLECTWREDRRDAMRVCAKLGIPFKTLDLEEEYKRGVVDYMLSEYKAGRTPNPDVMCNKEVKFGAFYDWARSEGADFIATGHYAQVEKHEDGFVMKKSPDETKDQAYFIWNIRKDQLPRILFPIGHLKKTDVRKLAATFKLPTATKKDSQGLCFIGKVNMKEFLKHYISEKQGKVINEQGDVVGQHDGAFFYTVGERHGFTITKKTPHDTPYYVISKDIEHNVLVVSNQSQEERVVRGVTSVVLGTIHWISYIPTEGKKYECQIRYHQHMQQCTFLKNAKGEYVVSFSTPQIGVSIGQSLVMYEGDICLGGGVIEHVEK